jgi:hypothetical protein
MLSYAGVPLLAPDEPLLAWGRVNLDWSWLPGWVERSWPGKGLARLGFGLHWPRGPVEVGKLVWPTGAQRWAHFHGVADSASLDLIRAQVYQGGGYQAQPLTVSDGVTSVSPSLWMLPPRPLSQVAGAAGRWLLTLVCGRFFWWFRAAAVTITGGTTTWQDLYAALGSALGVSVAVDPIPAAYLKPAADLATQYEALPPLLDAAAYSVGQRIVYGLDGSVRAWNADNSRSQALLNLAQPWPVQAGGQLALFPG